LGAFSIFDHLCWVLSHRIEDEPPFGASEQSKDPLTENSNEGQGGGMTQISLIRGPESLEHGELDELAEEISSLSSDYKVSVHHFNYCYVGPLECEVLAVWLENGSNAAGVLTFVGVMGAFFKENFQNARRRLKLPSDQMILVAV
jgi:hypothetical protein